MTHDVGIDALRDHEVRTELDMAKRAPQAGQVRAPPHVSAVDRDRLASKLVEERAFAHEREDRDVELPTKPGYQERPLSLSPSNDESGTGEQNSLPTTPECL